MLLKKDPEKTAALIIAAKPKMSKKMEEDDDDEMAEGVVSAAEDIMAAIKGNDAKSLSESLKNFITMCDEDY